MNNKYRMKNLAWGVKWNIWHRTNIQIAATIKLLLSRIIIINCLLNERIFTRHVQPNSNFWLIKGLVVGIPSQGHPRHEGVREVFREVQGAPSFSFAYSLLRRFWIRIVYLQQNIKWNKKPKSHLLRKLTQIDFYFILNYTDYLVYIYNVLNCTALYTGHVFSLDTFM